jgi:NAD(P)-dependent dehydrogenase (short-subunit alcohol dehydrogenase family)
MTAVPVVAVTGAGGAVGRATVEALAARGARVLALDVRREALAGLGTPRVLARACDATSREELLAACRAAEESLGPLAAFFNNAGIEGPLKPVAELSDDDVLTTYAVNVLGVVAGIAAAVELWGSGGNGGRILNMASGAGLRGTALMGAYVSSKHAVVGLTKCAALELAPSGIAVNALCPGCIESPMMSRVEAGLGVERGGWRSTIPAGRYADVGEIAETAAWLLLDAPLYLTGAAIPVDGGWAAG